MNANVRKWIAALRSGEYRQGRGMLCSFLIEPKYCCLGVACEVYRKEHPGYLIHDSVARARRAYGINRNVVLLPPEVADWLGLNNSLTNYTGARGEEGSLINDNDGRRLTFAQIADLIESEPFGLFKESSAGRTGAGEQSTENGKPEQPEGCRSLSPAGARDLVAVDA